MPPLIDLKHVTVIRNGRMALADVSLSIAHGENVAILGPNGCGKSTLVKTIARDFYPAVDKGSVRVGGLERWNLFDLRKILGIVSNELQYLCEKEFTALDVVVSGFFGSYGVLQPYDVTDVQRKQAKVVLEFLEASHLADRPACQLSSGEGRRVLIARSLVHSPKSLLLDEPTTSLDIKAASLLLKTMRQIADSGTNILLVTHHIEEILPEINRVILLKQGRVFLDGPTPEVLTSANLSELFEARVFVENQMGRYHADMTCPQSDIEDGDI